MAAVTTIHVTHGNEATATISDRFLKNATLKFAQAKELSKLFQEIASGSLNGKFEVQVDSSVAYATGTLTCASTAANDTFVVAGTTFTVVASGATGNQVNVGGTNAAMATAIADKINATSALSGIVTASASAAVVTITAAQRGKMGNGIQIAGTAVRLAASGTALSSGDGCVSTQNSYSFGA